MQKNLFLFPRPSISILWTLLIILVFSFDVHSQSVIRLEPSQDRNAVYNNYFSSYALGTLDKGQVVTLLQSRDQFDTLTVEANDKTYTFSLEANDVRADNYVLRVQTASGIEVLPRSPNKTYSGTTLDGDLPVCITADEHFFSAMIMTREGALFIESAKRINEEAGEDDFAIYYEKDLIQHAENLKCGVDTPDHHESPKPDSSGNRSMSGCITVELAIANDYDMYTKWSSSAAYVEVQNLAVLNQVNTNYDNEFDSWILHKVVEIFISAVPNTFYSGIESSLILNSFTAWAPTGFSTPHDAGTLWVNRWMDGPIGLAWLNQLCGDSSYNICQEYSLTMPWLRSLQAHELGHNYGFGHDVNPEYIMSSNNTGSNEWSSASISVLNTKFSQNGGCLGVCTGPSSGRVGIGTTSPHPTAMLEISSTSKGILFPRMTTLQRDNILSPAVGLTIYNITTKSFSFYNGSQWIEILGGPDLIKHNQNIGFGIPYPTNRLDIATSPRQNLGQFYHPANLPVYITGTSPDFKGLEVRSNGGAFGVGLDAGNNRGGVYATGWNNNIPLAISSQGTGNLLFRTNNLERARITGSGSLVIGSTTSEATAIVDINSPTKGILIPRMSTTERTAISNPATGLLVFDNITNSFWYKGSSAWIELSDNLDQEVYRNGPDKIYMGLTDSVGIGTNDPKYKLDVKTAGNQYGFAHTNGDIELASWIGDGAEIGTVSNHTMRLFAGNGFNQFSLLPNGNIGIGTNSPNAPLQFSNATTNRKIVLYEAANDEHRFFGLGVNIEGTLRYQVPVTVNDHVFYAGTSATTSNELMRIKGNGNVTVSGVVEVETFTSPALLNGYMQYGFGYANAAYYKDKMGRVFLRGTVTNVNDPDGLIIFNLPAGYRPSTSGRLMFEVINNGTTSRVDIMANGDVVVITGTAGWVNLDGISFKAD